MDGDVTTTRHAAQRCAQKAVRCLGTEALNCHRPAQGAAIPIRYREHSMFYDLNSGYSCVAALQLRIFLQRERI